MIDLRSDICAQPTREMWAAMRRTKPGWLLGGEDETLNELERIGAERLGKEAAVWTPTCGVANLAALLALGAPGAYVVAESEAHVLTSEAMGFSVIGGLAHLELGSSGNRLEPSELEAALHHVASLRDTQGAKIVCLENTHTRSGGAILSPLRTLALASVAHQNGAAVHLDGARLFNAAVALGVEVATLAAPVDTVAISLNKGLAAPFGALLCGGGHVIGAARQKLRQLGAATVHKAGIAAAAGIVALNHMVSRLQDDNRRARDLGERVDRIDGLRLDPGTVETNIVLVDVSGTGLSGSAFAQHLRESGVLCLVRDERRIRLVTHRSIGDNEVASVAAAIASVCDRSDRG